MGISLGLVGLGSFGSAFAPLFKSHPMVDRIALCDSEPDRVKYWAERESFQDKLNPKDVYETLDDICKADLDGLVIITQPFFHAPQLSLKCSRMIAAKGLSRTTDHISKLWISLRFSSIGWIKVITSTEEIPQYACLWRDRCWKQITAGFWLRRSSMSFTSPSGSPCSSVAMRTSLCWWVPVTAFRAVIRTTNGPFP